MVDGAINSPTPQFGTAEYMGTPGGDHCQFYHQPIAGNYYRANGAMSCPSCAEKMRGELAKDTHAAYVRALLFGVGAAVLGMILYATFEILTGIIIGYASLAVGWMVGKAMIKGSNGIGGRRYQIAAVLLTYAAVSTAAIPVWIHYAGQQKHQQQQKSSGSQGDLDSGSDATSDSGGDSGQPQPTKPRPTMISALGTLLLMGLASPFLELSDMPGGLIGLFILFIGMKFAWQFTAAKPMQVFGPFENSPQAPR
jgi:hypothetical protein